MIIVGWGKFRLSKIIGGGRGVPRTTSISYSAKKCISHKLCTSLLMILEMKSPLITQLIMEMEIKK